MDPGDFLYMCLVHGADGFASALPDVQETGSIGHSLAQKKLEIGSIPVRSCSESSGRP